MWDVGKTSASCVGTLSIRPSGTRTSSNLAVYTLAVSPAEDTVLFSGGADYRVHMFDLRERTLLHTLTGHASTVRALCFTPSGDRLCSSGGDFNLLVWRLQEKSSLRTPGTDFLRGQISNSAERSEPARDALGPNEGGVGGGEAGAAASRQSSDPPDSETAQL